ncbi:MAG: transposase [Reyranella sp.]|nr:transposase [Reyranella sp.]
MAPKGSDPIFLLAREAHSGRASIASGAGAGPRGPKELSRSFSRLYSHEGRPSIPPEQLLSALLLQVLYGIRSERQLMEQLDYNLLFRWFVGLSPDDRVWDATSFTKNRERLQQGQVFDKFMAKCWNSPRSSRCCRLQLPWPEAQERPPCLDQRSRRQALSQGGRPRGQAELHGTRRHGEPPRLGRRRQGQPGQRHGRTTSLRGLAQAQSQTTKWTDHGRRGQGV